MNDFSLTIEVTPRQRDMLDALMLDGADNATIARRMGVGYETVKDYMKTILSSTGLTSRTSLVLALERRQVKVHVVNRNLLPENADNLRGRTWVNTVNTRVSA